MKRTVLIGMLGGFILSSCSVTRHSYTTARIDTHVTQYPTVADIDVQPKAEKTATWRFQLFGWSRQSLETRRDNLTADILKEKGADVLVEPQSTLVKRPFGKRTLTVSGYPASFQNFRKADKKELAALAGDESLSDGQWVYDVSGSDKAPIRPVTRIVDERKTQWIARLGIGANMMVNSSYQGKNNTNAESRFGYLGGIEYRTYFRQSWYWNAALYFNSRGADYWMGGNEVSFSAHMLQLPVGVGYKLPLQDGLALDFHFAPFLSVDYLSPDDTGGSHPTLWSDDLHRFDVGLMMGVGLWIKSWNIDFGYQRGFLSPINNNLNLGKQSAFRASVGFAF